MSLTALLITVLFSFFVESAKIDQKLDTIRSALTHRSHLQIRLQTVLTAIDKSASSSFFYTELTEKEKTLQLTALFDNGIDPDPAFSGTITARISLDAENNLCLFTSPLSKEKNLAVRKEILCPNVESFEFEFLGKKPEAKEHCRPITATLAWRTNWPKSERETPSIIRLTIREKSCSLPIRYAFILPVIEPLVIYRGREIS